MKSHQPEIRQRLEPLRMRVGPAGIHLFNRASGLNLLIDEVVLPQSAWSEAPRHVSIAITNSCDLSCRSCFAPKSRDALPIDLVVSWLDELNANGTIGIGFGGGEPTLHPQFVDMCAYASNNTNLAVTFTTHGHHLIGARLEALRGIVHLIRVSMDGIDETYERLRGRSFSSLRERLEAIREVSQFGINYLVNSETICDISPAVAFSEKIGASQFLLLPERPAFGKYGISPSTAQVLQEWVRHYSGNLPLAVGEGGEEGMPICDPFQKEIGLFGYVHIDANGILKETSYSREGVVIGREGFISALRKLHQQTRVMS